MKLLLKKAFQFIQSIIYSQRFISKADFLALLPTQAVPILEIGPFTNPCLRGPNVSYFDVLDRAGLLNRARVENYPIANLDAVPDIDFVSPTGDLSIIDRTFSAVFSSHCIEHQPDLITHLQHISSLLEPEGRYYIIIPDKRYCFDAFLPESNLATVVEAYLQKRKAHTPRSVIEHRALTTHNSAWQHWLGNHGKLANMAEKTESALHELTQANGRYVDVHAWQFTPQSFRELINLLNAMGYIDFKVEQVYITPVFALEFYALLTKKNGRN